METFFSYIRVHNDLLSQGIHQDDETAVFMEISTIKKQIATLCIVNGCFWTLI